VRLAQLIPLEDISWDNVNESTLLQEQIERYHDRMGVYPVAVLGSRPVECVKMM